MIAIIPFELLARSMVTLTVYNILGRELFRLFDGPMKAGFYQLGWNANGLPSGIYYCRISTPSEAQIVKIVLEG